MKHAFTAIVPMRHESKRIQGKNYRDFCGRPLYHRIIDTLLAAPEVSSVVIDTDSPAITADAASCFPMVKVLVRPEHLRAGDVPMNDVLKHTVNQLEGDYFLQCHATSPLLRPVTISRAICRYFDVFPENDSLFSVTRLQTRLWDHQGRPMNHNPEKLLRTQDLPPVFEENSAFFLFSRELIESRGNRIGLSPLPFETDRLESWDVDEELDFITAEYFFRKLYPEKI